MKSLFRFSFLLASVAIITTSSCGKKSSGGGGGGGGNNNEADLAVTLTPPTGSTQAPSVGPFNLSVAVTSAMPPSGVKIDVSAKRDDGSNTVFFTQTLTNSTATNNFSITNTPNTVVCLVEVKVTSVSKATNVWNGSYRYSKK
jgi:hypothetical protein